MGVFSRRRQAVVSPPVDDGLVRMMSRCRCSAAPVQKQAAWVGTQESKWACCSCGLVMPRDEVLQLMHGVYWRKLTGADEASAWARWLDTNRQQLQQASPWQLRFAEDVLAKCPGLVSDWVTIEHPFVDNQGQGRRIDFAVLPPGAIKLALEVDGYDKSGRGSGMTPPEFADFLARQNALVADGWTVLRFANSTVRDDPRGCLQSLRSAIGPVLAASETAAPAMRDESQPPKRRMNMYGACICVIGRVKKWNTVENPDECTMCQECGLVLTREQARNTWELRERAGRYGGVGEEYLPREASDANTSDDGQDSCCGMFWPGTGGPEQGGWSDEPPF